MQHKNLGFSLMELLIVIGIMAVLVATAIPSYQNYLRRAHYTEIVQAAAPFKIGVEECYQTTSDLESCSSGSNGVPPSIESNTLPNLIDSVEVVSGIITVSPKKKFGIQPEDTYILTPTEQQGSLLWITSGGGVQAGYAH